MKSQFRHMAQNGQVSIPKNIRDKFHLYKGQLVRISVRDDRIILTPLVLEKKEIKNAKS